MKICIDARWILPEISGIDEYTRELLHQLSQKDKENEYVVLFRDQAVCDRTVKQAGLADAPNFSTHLLPYGVFSPIGQLKLPLWLKSAGIDVFHSPNFMIPMLAFPRNRPGRTKCVVTVHDVIPMIFPKEIPRSKKSRMFPVYRWIMKQVGARADAILTDSNASRRDVIKHLGIKDEDKVHTIYLGVADRFELADRRETDPDPARCRTMLYIGRTDPYKNLVTLVRSLVDVKKNCPHPFMLRVIGSPDPRYPEPREAAAELAVEDCIDWAGYLSDEDLAEAYRTADLLVHPSRYEGFGLQILEAMTCGVPVVCSNGGSLPEVAGDAAIIVDPDDVEGFSTGITQVLTDPETAAGMVKRGFAHAATFSWTRTVDETLAVYRAMVR